MNECSVVTLQNPSAFTRLILSLLRLPILLLLCLRLAGLLLLLVGLEQRQDHVRRRRRHLVQLQLARVIRNWYAIQHRQYLIVPASHHSQ